MDATGLDVLGRLLPALAIIVGALLFVRRWARRQAGPGNGVRVLGRTGIARGAMVAVVAIGERRFLVGAGEHGVSLLGELDPDDTPDAPEGAPPSALQQHAATDPAAVRRPAVHGPWMGLVDRLRAMTVRTHLERPIRAGRP